MQRQDEDVMSPERWERLQELYHTALPIDQRNRCAYLSQACAGDEELRREAESLLADDNFDFLQNPIFDLGLQVLADKESRGEKMDSETTQVFEAGISIGMRLKGRYEIVEKLDAGGMGEIYKARDLEFPKRFVVVKVPKPNSQNNPLIVTKFGREAKEQGRIQHHNVAMVFDKGTLESGEPYLVIEFIDGRTLRRIIKDYWESDQPMDFALVAEIIRQAGRGVEAIHKAGLIHCDLKPANLMIQNEANLDELLVKVIDFGIVRALVKSTEESTVIGQADGTPLYMSPEQFDGKPTHASDVYALGEISYEMLTGHRPFNPENLGHLLKLKQGKVKAKPGDLRPGLPPAAEDLILTALSPKATERQRSAQEFSNGLARALTEIGEPPVRWPKWWLAAAAALVLIAVIAGVLWRGVYVERPAPHLEPSVPPLAIYWHGFGHEKKGAEWKDFTIHDGMTLHSGDQFRLIISPNEDCYAYVIIVEADGTVKIPFPSTAIKMDNRLRAGGRYEIPDGRNWFELNDSTGTETLYLLASYDPLDALDSLVGKLSADAQSPSLKEQLKSEISSLAKPPDLSAPTLRTRSGKIVTRGVEVRPDQRLAVATLGNGQREEQAMQFELGEVNVVKRIQIHHDPKP